MAMARRKKPSTLVDLLRTIPLDDLDGKTLLSGDSKRCIMATTLPMTRDAPPLRLLREVTALPRPRRLAPRRTRADD